MKPTNILILFMILALSITQSCSNDDEQNIKESLSGTVWTTDEPVDHVSFILTFTSNDVCNIKYIFQYNDILETGIEYFTYTYEYPEIVMTEYDSSKQPIYRAVTGGNSITLYDNKTNKQYAVLKKADSNVDQKKGINPPSWTHGTWKDEVGLYTVTFTSDNLIFITGANTINFTEMANLSEGVSITEPLNTDSEYKVKFAEQHFISERNPVIRSPLF